mgnify:FL=1
MIKLIVVLVLIMLVIPILKSFISDYDKCYSEKEYDGIAVFGCCRGMVGGTRNTENLSEMCIDCPYYTKEIAEEVEK